MGDGNSFPSVVCVFSGNFGVRKCYVCVQVSIYIDIYF